jgi:2-methylisocitrate lyase-like PEP mutase family enzyme
MTQTTRPGASPSRPTPPAGTEPGRVRATTRLHRLIHAPELLVMPAAYDALSARLIEEAGFAAVQCSGMGIALAHGVPDFSILSMREMVDATRTLARAVAIPVMGDADTGYGGVVNVWHGVREFEAAGAAGMNLEDQVFPKRCGRIAGKELVSLREMALKVEAAAQARTDDHFVINARTDALGMAGIEAAIERGNAYLKAGATMVFIQGVSTREEMARLVGEIDGPVGINLMEQHANCADVSFEEMQRLGIARVSLSASTMLAAIHGMRKALAGIAGRGGTRLDPEVFAPFEDLHRIAGMPEALAIEQRFSGATPEPSWLETK